MFLNSLRNATLVIAFSVVGLSPGIASAQPIQRLHWRIIEQSTEASIETCTSRLGNAFSGTRFSSDAGTAGWNAAAGMYEYFEEHELHLRAVCRPRVGQPSIFEPILFIARDDAATVFQAIATEWYFASTSEYGQADIGSAVTPIITNPEVCKASDASHAFGSCILPTESHWDCFFQRDAATFDWPEGRISPSTVRTCILRRNDDLRGIHPSSSTFSAPLAVGLSSGHQRDLPCNYDNCDAPARYHWDCYRGAAPSYTRQCLVRRDPTEQELWDHSDYAPAHPSPPASGK